MTYIVCTTANTWGGDKRYISSPGHETMLMTVTSSLKHAYCHDTFEAAQAVVDRIHSISDNVTQYHAYVMMLMQPNPLQLTAVRIDYSHDDGRNARNLIAWIIAANAIICAAVATWVTYG